MASYNTVLLLILITVSYRKIAAQSFNCSEEIRGPQGELSIPANTQKCEFSTPDGTVNLILDTDGLFLAANDTLIIKSIGQGNSFTYAPPVDAGYLHIGGGFARPGLTFNFPDAKNPPMTIKFSTIENFPINVDMNHNFKIINVGVSQSLQLSFLKSLNEAVHIELNPPQLNTKFCILGNYLMRPNETKAELFLSAVNDELIHVTTTIVEKTCSNTFESLTKPQEISGPQKVTKPYQCVNLFRLTENPSKEAHFDVDFTNFISLAADSDELIIRDSRRRLFIDRTSEVGYRGRKLSGNGSELIIEYKSPDISHDNVDLGLKLTIIPESIGGIVSEKKDLLLAANIPVTYTLIPNESKCVSIRSTGQKSLSDSNLTLSVGGSVSSKFGPNSLLPPLIGLSEPSHELLLSYSGKKELNGLQYIPDGMCCNQLSSDSSGRFSVDGGQNESCFWTIATNGDVSINIDENDFVPNGCITIQSLNSERPLYDRCNISSNEIIPKFVVSQAFVKVTLPSKNTRFSASLSARPAKMSLSEDGRITTPGYPVYYPVISDSQEIFTLNATKKNYLINVADLDLRSGEKLLISQEEVNASNLLTVGDLLVVNMTLNVTVARPAKQTDFSLRRGLKINTVAFKDYLIINTADNNSTTLNNVSDHLVKIQKQSSRVNYIISPKKLPDGVELKLYDGRSVSSPVMTTLNGSTTSDTLMLIAKATKPNVTIPSLKIDYSYSACNRTDDLVCDNSTRCVPRAFQCKGIYYCIDGSDMKQVCNSSGPPPPVQPGNGTGVGGFTVFILCTLMLTLGVLLSTYGPGVYRTLEERFRGSGQYNTFTSVE